MKTQLRTTFCALMVLCCALGSASAEDPYRVDGWEEYPAPIVDRWVLAAGFSSFDDLAPWTKPDVVGGAEGLFAEEGAMVGSRMWQAADSLGRGVPLPRSTDGAWVLAFTLLNAEMGKEAFLNASAPGARQIRIFVDGVEKRKLQAPDLRLERLPITLATGWHKLEVAAEVGADDARLYLQFVDEKGETCPLYNLARLTPQQKNVFTVGFPMRGNLWKRLTDRHRSILNEPHSDYWRELALLQAGLKGDSAAVAGAKKRLRAIRELTRLIVHGGHPDQLKQRLAAVRAQFEGFSGMKADESGFPQETARRAAKVEPWIDPGGIQAVTWHVLDQPESFTDLWGRMQFFRLLFLDLLEYGRKVVSEAKSGL